MCGPVEVLTGLGTAVSAVGSMRQGSAANAAAEANARVAEQQAQTERDVGQIRVAQVRRDQRRRQSEQIVAGSAQGTALTGQFVDILSDDARQDALERAFVRHEAATRASGFETRAEFARFEGRARQERGFFRAGTALLAGGTRIAGRFAG